MRRLIALCLACMLLFVACPIDNIRAADNGLLSERSDGEILAFLDEYDVEIPNGFAESNAELARIVRAWITAVENNPNIHFNYNFTVSYDFSNSIKDAVNNYYSVTPSSGLISTFSASAYTLQQSILWSIPEYPDMFNCYAYALGRSDMKCDPGMFSTAFSNYQLSDMDASDLADRVIADLKSDEYGYECVLKTTTRPDYEDLTSTQTAICIRKGQDDWGLHDYHLARLFYETEDEYGDAWRHKPGETYILQYINYPSSDVDWISEYYCLEGAKLNEYGKKYTGTIYYIIFAESCNDTTPILIHNYHQGTTHYYQYSKTCLNTNVTKTYTISEFCNGTSCGDPGVYPQNHNQEAAQ